MLAYVGLRVARTLALTLPPEPSRALALGSGRLSYFVSHEMRRNLLANLRQVLGPEASEAQLRRIARRVFDYQGLNYLDLLRLPETPPEALMARSQIDGLETLRQTLQEGGAVLIGPHMGAFDPITQVLLLLGKPVALVAEELRPRALFEFVRGLRSSHGLTVFPARADETGELLAFLREGGLLFTGGDRDVLGNGIPVPFFGRPAPLPPGPALLALRARVPLFVAGAWRDERTPDRYRGFIYPPLRVERRRGERIRAALQRALEEVARRFEPLIRAHLDQWQAFYPIWTRVSGEEVTSTGSS